MKNILSLLIIVILFGSCCNVPPDSKTSAFYKEVEVHNSKKETSKIELRQLAQTTKTEKYSSGGFFFIVGGFSSSEKTEQMIQMFGNVDGYYRLISIPLEKVRIKITNDTIPYIIIAYKSDKMSDTEALDKVNDWSGYIRTCTIFCQEKLLPEKLLPIEIPQNKLREL